MFRLPLRQLARLLPLLFALFAVPAAQAQSVDLTLDVSASAMRGREVRVPVDSQTKITLRLANSSDEVDATGVVVELNVPSGLTIEDGSSSIGTYEASTWQVGTVAARARETLSLTVQVRSRSTRNLSAWLQRLDQQDPGGTIQRVRVVPVR